MSNGADKLSKLRELITEGLRVQRDGDPIAYINVGHAVEDAGARANHAIFARRGCGKTLLLHESRNKLREDCRSVYLNCEDFKQHTFPNVLIEILKVLFREIDGHLSGWFGKKVRTKAIVKQILSRLPCSTQATYETCLTRFPMMRNSCSSRSRKKRSESP